jgi:hypothetical protein
MATTEKIRLASRAYDGTLPILRGQMKIPGFEFDISETEDVPGMFAGMFKGLYDISEMSLGELIYYASRDKADFVGIPVFPSRMFRHGFIFVRKDSGIRRPSDLNGKKLGFLRWVQTAAIWMRGMLIDEYGVSATDSEWYVASMHHWDDHDPGATVKPCDGSVIRILQNSGKSTPERACRALFDGQVDALGVTESQLTILSGDTSVKKLLRTRATWKPATFATHEFCRSCTCWHCKRILLSVIPSCRKSFFAFTLMPKVGRSAGGERYRA